jgi:hypothetical protein
VRFRSVRGAYRSGQDGTCSCGFPGTGRITLRNHSARLSGILIRPEKAKTNSVEHDQPNLSQPASRSSTRGSRWCLTAAPPLPSPFVCRRHASALVPCRHRSDVSIARSFHVPRPCQPFIDGRLPNHNHRVAGMRQSTLRAFCDEQPEGVSPMSGTNAPLLGAVLTSFFNDYLKLQKGLPPNSIHFYGMRCGCFCSLPVCREDGSEENHSTRSRRSRCGSRVQIS